MAHISNERSQVLIVDGHESDSHNFVELLKVAMANQIEIVELPAHTSNWLQPCDCTVFKQFKDAMTSCTPFQIINSQLFFNDLCVF